MDQHEAGFRSGDSDSLVALYKSTGALVYTYCLRTVGAENAARTTGEIFVSAWNSRHNFDPDRTSFAAWIMTIARRRCIDEFQRSGRPPEEEVGDRTGAAISEVARIQGMADRMVLAEALEELSNRARQHLEPALLDNLDCQQISERTGSPVGTVRSDIRRGLLSVRRHLDDLEPGL